MSTSGQTTALEPASGNKILLWYLATHGLPPADLLSELGLSNGELETLMRDQETELTTMRQHAASISLMDRNSLGQLILSCYLTHLMQAQNSREAATLLKVAKQLPHWVLPINAAHELASTPACQSGSELFQFSREAKQTPVSRQQRRAQAAKERKANRH